MSLTETTIRAAKPRQRPAKLFDGKGLYLEVSPAGGKWWRLKYRYAGKEKRLSLGIYPEISLKEARDRRDEARKLLANGVDPSVHRQVEKLARVEQAANSFEAVAREWYAKQSPKWSPDHAARILRRLDKDIFSQIGGRPIAEAKAIEVLAAVRRIEDRDALDTAHRAMGTCSQIFRYAVATGRIDRDPTRDLRGALSPAQGGHFAAQTEPRRFAEILKMLDAYEGTFIVQCALRLAPLVFARPGELRRAEWADIDLEAKEWRYVVTKTKTQHIVPLSRQAVDILRELQSLTGDSRYVFPGARSNKRPMSDNAILAALRRLGIPKEEMSGHGFRAAARTILDEVLGVRPDFIEHQLAHSVRDPNGRAYNRTAHLPERCKMMQVWADYLDELKAGKRDNVRAIR